MKINNTNIDTFSARVISFSPSTLSIDNNLILPESNYNVISGKQVLSAQSRTLVIDIRSEEDISNLTALIKDQFTLDLDDGYFFKCYTKKAPYITEEAYQFYTYYLDVYCVKQKAKVTKTNVLSFIVEGNIYADCTYRITSTSLLESFTINAMTISNLAANDTLVIDGIAKKIYYASNPDTSAFDDVDLEEFPKLDPGQTTITLSDETVDLVVEYWPTYI